MELICSRGFTHPFVLYVATPFALTPTSPSSIFARINTSNLPPLPRTIYTCTSLFVTSFTAATTAVYSPLESQSLTFSFFPLRPPATCVSKSAASGNLLGESDQEGKFDE